MPKNSNANFNDKNEYITIITRATGYEHDVHLHNEVSSPDFYTELYDVCKTATDKDIINVIINNYGGQVHSALQIIHMLKMTKAVVVCKIMGKAMSAAAQIALAGHYLVMYPCSHMLFHNYSGGSFGKGNELVEGVAADNKFCHDVLDTYCFPFLSRKEIAAVKKDRDIHIYHDTADLETRVNRHFKVEVTRK